MEANQQLFKVEGLAKRAVKAAIGTLFGLYGVDVPDGVDTLDFAKALIQKIALDGLQTNGLTLDAVHEELRPHAAVDPIDKETVNHH